MVKNTIFVFEERRECSVVPWKIECSHMSVIIRCSAALRE